MKLLIYGKWWGAMPLRTLPLTLFGIDSYFYYRQPNFSSIGEWFIGALLACYALFPLLRALLKRVPYLTAAVLVAGCFFVPYMPVFDVEPWHNIWTCTTIFYLGCLLAQHPVVFTSRAAFIISGLLLLLVSVVPMPLKEIQAMGQLIYPIVSGLACFVFSVHIGACLQHISRNNHVMHHLAVISYPIFLVQHFIISAVLVYWHPHTLGDSIGTLCMTTVLTFLLADVIQVVFERLVTLHRQTPAKT